MPCYRCGRRQDDPVRGASPWKRAVRRQAQVLVCPDCQRSAGWSSDVDHCPGCGSTALVRALGETRCRGCGRSDPDAAPPAVDSPAVAPPTVAPPAAPGLAEEVAAALDRRFGREPR